MEPSPGGQRLVLEAVPRSDLGGDARPWSDLEIGESIAVNGCCLTLVEGDDDRLAFDVIPETLRCTALEDLAPGRLVNLERSLRVGDRLGGHYVTGHVDAVGRVQELRQEGEETILGIEVESGTEFAVIPKGSVAIDGISLTVVDAQPGRFTVALIPHTLEQTNLRDRGVGERVNLEMDHLAKWVQHLLGQGAGNVE